jgi:hypothetical protein
MLNEWRFLAAIVSKALILQSPAKSSRFGAVGERSDLGRRRSVAIDAGASNARVEFGFDDPRQRVKGGI